MAATDLLALAPISIIVGVAQSIPNLDGTYVALRVDAMLRERRPAGRGPAVLDRKLEWLRKGVEFEQSVEGQRVTPRWWLIEEATRSVVEFCTGILPGILEDYVSQSALQDAELGQSVKLQAIASFRGLELLTKLGVHTETVSNSCLSLTTARHLTSDPWPDMNEDVLHAKISSLRAATIQSIARISPKLSIEDRNVGDEPDFFGRANAVLLDAVFHATLRGDASQVKEVFPSTFLSTLQLYEKLRAKLDPHAEPLLLQNQLLSTTYPLIDLLEHSGYALLAAELGQPQVWSEIQSVWSIYLEKHSEFIPHVFSVLRLLDSGLEYLRSSVASTQREMEFWRTMLGDEGDGMRFGYGGRNLRHKSPLVELTAQQTGDFKPRTAFTSQYLVPKYSGDGAVPDEVLRFQESLEREIKRRELN
jgi:hypothetical protein